jgi:hypothetical protein
MARYPRWALLAVFRSCFTAPGHRSFAALAVGLIAQTQRRTVCGMLLGAGLERAWHHCRAHRFFTTARWCTDALGLALGDLIVARPAPKEPGWEPRPTWPSPAPGAPPGSAVTDAPTPSRSAKRRACGTGHSAPRPSASSWSATLTLAPARGDDRGHGLPLITTDLLSPAEDLIAATPPAGASRSPSSTPARASASARPATAPGSRWNAPCRSA